MAVGIALKKILCASASLRQNGIKALRAFSRQLSAASPHSLDAKAQRRGVDIFVGSFCTRIACGRHAAEFTRESPGITYSIRSGFKERFCASAPPRQN